MKNWDDIWKEFFNSTGISADKIDVYRPHLSFDNYPAIKVWLKDGNCLIYVYKGE